MKYDVYSLGIMIAVISFLGFVSENLWLAVTKGYMDNRNMTAPFLFGYGLLIAVMYMVLGVPEAMIFFGLNLSAKSKTAKYILYFLCSMIIVSVCEIVLGMAMEKICGFEYWNYNWIPLHITKYTSIPTSIGFAAMITFLMGVCFEPLMEMISCINPLMAKIISSVLMSIMITDFVLSFYKMYKKRSLNIRWQKQIKHRKLRLT